MLLTQIEGKFEFEEEACKRRMFQGVKERENKGITEWKDEGMC